SDLTNTSSTAAVTVQVVNFTSAGIPLASSSSYLAELDVNALDVRTGQPITTALNVGDQFLVQVTAKDLRPGGDLNNRGVVQAYLDLLTPLLVGDPTDPTDPNDPLNKKEFVSPVLSPDNPLGMDITFNGGSQDIALPAISVNPP